MATTIGGVSIDLILNSAAFQRNVAKAQLALATETAKMRQSLKELERAANFVTKGLGTLGLAFGVREIVSFAGRALQAGANLGELAEQTGVSTDALQALQYAAVQSNVKTGELEAGLMRLTRSLGEAAQGNTNVIKAFRDMGVSTVDANGKLLSTEQVLSGIAEAYVGAADKARFMAAAAEVGGRSFQRLAPLLSSGAEGLQGWERAAREAGVVLDKEVIQRLDTASDRIDRFWFAFTQHATRAIASVISIADELDLRNAERELGRVNQQIELLRKNSGSGALIKNFEQQKQTLEAYIAKLREVAKVEAERRVGSDDSGFFGEQRPKEVRTQETEAQNKFDESIKQRLETLREEAALVGMSAREIFIATEVRKAEADALKQQLTLSEERKQKLREEAAALFDKKAAEEANADAMKRFTAELEADDAAWRKRAETIASMPKTISFDLQREADDLKRLTEAAGESNKAYETEVELLDIRNKLRAAGLPSGEAEIEQYRSVAENVGEWRDKLTEAKDRLDDAKQASRDFSHAIGTAFEDAVLSGKKFSDVLRALAQDIQRIVLRMLVTKQIESMVGSALNGFSFSGLFGGGGGGAEAQAIGATFAGSGFRKGAAFASGNVIPFARGGLVNGPTVFPMARGMGLMGEAGPEAVLPLSRTRTGDLGVKADGWARGGGDTFYIDARGADRQGFIELRGMLMQLAGPGKVEERALRATSDARRRGGKYAAAFK